MGYFDDLLKELAVKISQLESGIAQGAVPNRSEFEQLVWMTGRVIRVIVKPDKSPERKTFWSECKGWLKDVIVIELFNAGQFTKESVRKDVMEKDLLLCLQKLEKYTRGRSEGKVM